MSSVRVEFQSTTDRCRCALVEIVGIQSWKITISNRNISFFNLKHKHSKLPTIIISYLLTLFCSTSDFIGNFAFAVDVFTILYVPFQVSIQKLSTEWDKKWKRWQKNTQTKPLTKLTIWFIVVLSSEMLEMNTMIRFIFWFNVNFV